MTPAELASRRALLLETAGRLGVLVSVPPGGDARPVCPPSAPVPPAPKPPRPRPARKPAVRRPVCRAVPAPPEMLVPGTWVAFRPHLRPGCPEVVGRIIASLPAGTPASVVLDPELMAHVERHSKLECSTRIDRVVMAVPNARRALGELRTVPTGTLARGRIVPPPQANRLITPVSPGVLVHWSWHSSKGLSRCSGVVLGYVPAGSSIASALPGLHLRHGLIDVSNQDRYVVRLTGPRRKRLHTPAAHLIERAFLPHQPEEECAI